MKINFYVLYFLIAFAPFCITITYAKDVSPVKNGVIHHLQQSDVLFIENNGQLTDGHGRAKRDVDFSINGKGLDIYIGEGKLHYRWVQQAAGSRAKGAAAHTYRMDVELLGANTKAKAIAGDKQSYYEQYILPQYKGKASSYHKVTYKDVYPNIDWVLYSNAGALKYDFIVHPGGNPKDIKLRYNGATSLHVKDGAMVATTPMGSVTEQRPYSYNAATKQEVASSFVLEHNNTIGFNTGSYSGTLVIDPAVEWATYYGGENQDMAADVATTADGTTYICGRTTSQTGIATSGSFQDAFNTSAGDNGYIAKFNNAGVRQWATYISGNVTAITLDDTYDFVYATGVASVGGWSTDGTVKSGSLDAFLIKFDNSGALDWATYIGGSLQELASDVKVDHNGFVFVAGITSSLNNIATANTHQQVRSGSSDVFLVKYHTGGFKVWGTYFGGSQPEDAPSNYAIAIDPANDVYLSGATSSTAQISSPGGQQAFKSGGFDAFLVKFSSGAGTRLWGTYYGGSGNDFANDVVCDTWGNVYLCGYTASPNNIATPGTHKTALSGAASNMFLAKFNMFGIRQWGTYYSEGFTYAPTISPSPFNRGNMAFAPSGYIYMCGTKNTGTVNAHDVAIARMVNNTGKLDFDTTFGGTSDEMAGSLALDSAENIYLAGTTRSLNIATPGSHQSAHGNPSFTSPEDGFLAKFRNTDTNAYFKNLKTLFTSYCPGGTFTIKYGVTTPFKAGNVFKVHIYDATDTFEVGSVTATGVDTIDCTVPSGIIPVRRFKLRLTSTAPADTIYDLDMEFAVVQINATITGDTMVCEGEDIRLMALPQSPSSTYVWKRPNGTSDPGSVLVVEDAKVSDSGNYIVTITRPGCVSKDTFHTNVYPIPDLPVASCDSPVCERDTFFLRAFSATPGAGYHWTGPNGFNFGSAIPEIYIANVQLNQGGTYSVVANINGCKSAPVTVATTVKPLPVFSVTNNSPICEDDTLRLFVTSNANDTPYHWTGPNSFVADSMRPVIYRTPYLNGGVYTVKASLDGCAGTATTNVNVKPKPRFMANNSSTASVFEDEELKFYIQDEQFPGASFTWSGPNRFESIDKEPSIKNVTDSATGTYRVTAILNGCIYTGITNVIIYKRKTEYFILYPIPNNGNFTVEGKVKSDQTIFFEVASSANQVISKDYINTVNKKFKTQIWAEDQLANGQYYFRAKIDGTWHSVPFTIIK